MRIAASQPVLATISAQSPGTPLSIGISGTGTVGYGLRLPDHLIDQSFIGAVPDHRSSIRNDGDQQMSEEVQKIVSAIADICGAPSIPDMLGPSVRLTEAFGKDLATIDLVEIGLDAGDLVLMMLPEIKPLSVTLNLIKIGHGLFGIWSKSSG